MMMDGMTCCGPMMWVMLALYALVVAVLLLAGVALVKYVFGKRKKD